MRNKVETHELRKPENDTMSTPLKTQPTPAHVDPTKLAARQAQPASRSGNVRKRKPRKQEVDAAERAIMAAARITNADAYGLLAEPDEQIVVNGKLIAASLATRMAKSGIDLLAPDVSEQIDRALGDK